jgi:NADH-quinone oxidoreductase subunit C
MVDAQGLAAQAGCEIAESIFRDNRRFFVSAECLYRVLHVLRDEHGFDMLIDISAVDYLEYPEAANRFGVIYLLLNVTTGERLIVKTLIDPPQAVLPTVTGLWAGANWMEREVFDMFGIEFAGHPDLRRILLPEEFTAFPLQKDYPLQGRGERHNFPVITRAES